MNNSKSTINELIKKALQNMTSTVTTLVENNPTVPKNTTKIDQLKAENFRLNRQVQVLSSEQGKL